MTATLPERIIPNRHHYILLLASLALILFFTASAVLIPDLGFRFKWMSDPTRPFDEIGTSIFREPGGYIAVAAVFKEHPISQHLRKGDLILKVDEMAPHANSNWHSLFKPLSRSYSYTVRREESVFGIANAPTTPLTPGLLFDRLILGALGLSTWIIGALVITQARHRYDDARLAGYALIVAALVLATFGAQRYGVALTWLGIVPMLPFLIVAIVQTAMLPREGNTGERERRIFQLFYAVAALVTLIALFEVLFLYPQGRNISVFGIRLYFLAMIFLSIALALNPLILGIRALRLPRSYQRIQITILLAFTLAAVIPFVALTLLPSLLHQQDILPRELTLPLMALIPLGYGYTIYRWRYLKLDIFVTRTFPTVLLGLALVSLYSFISISLSLTISATPVPSGLFLLIAIMVTPWIGKPVGDFVQTLIYGSEPPSQETLNELMGKMARKPELASVQQALDALPLLLGVSQSVLLITDKDEHWSVLKGDVLEPVTETLPSPATVAAHGFATKLADSVLPQNRLLAAYPWAEAFLPLRNGARLFGVLILGPPMPDGHYNSKQVATLQQFANMLVVTVESILLYESARDMALDLVSARDAERTNLALIIHDEPLQHLTLLAALVPEHVPRLRQGLSAVANQLREIMASLHSPVLKQSLPRAILEAAEEFQDQHQITVRVHSLISDEMIIPLDVGNAFYQVLRESLHNVLKHADATLVDVTLVHEQGELRMTVADDGQNGGIPNTSSVHELIQGRHFGLVGMHQRTALLGGQWRLRPDAKGGSTVTMSVPFHPKHQLSGPSFL